jgi:NAD(P)-dependent dehydrogenase (short-subunit alcohol dehydrogenase family)
VASNNVLIFGATGALGGAIHARFDKANWNIYCAVRSPSTLPHSFLLPITADHLPAEIADIEFDAVIFAQGTNTNDNVMNGQTQELLRVFEGNVITITEATAGLMHHNKIKQGGRIVILSSLWELSTRQDKMSYTVSKAAVGGLVRSMAVDLGRAKGILVNGILPGIVQTPMAEKLLAPSQIANVASSTPVGRLVSPEDVGNSAYLLACESNTAISGQSIFVDNGFSVSRVI